MLGILISVVIDGLVLVFPGALDTIWAGEVGSTILSDARRLWNVSDQWKLEIFSARRSSRAQGANRRCHDAGRRRFRHLVHGSKWLCRGAIAISGIRSFFCSR